MCTNPPLKTAYYCELGLIRSALKHCPLPASILIKSYPWPWDLHLFPLAIGNILYYLNTTWRTWHGLFVPDPQLNHNSTQRIQLRPNVCKSKNVNPVLWVWTVVMENIPKNHKLLARSTGKQSFSKRHWTTVPCFAPKCLFCVPSCRRCPRGVLSPLTGFIVQPAEQSLFEPFGAYWLTNKEMRGQGAADASTRRRSFCLSCSLIISQRTTGMKGMRWRWLVMCNTTEHISGALLKVRFWHAPTRSLFYIPPSPPYRVDMVLLQPTHSSVECGSTRPSATDGLWKQLRLE